MLQLVNDRVAVTPIFDADTSPGGIIIPDVAKERCDQGIVKYVGPNVKDIKIGQYVLFSGYTGTLVHIAGEGSVIIMPEEFIVAVLDEIENTFVPGLFYKSRVDQAKRFQELSELISSAIVDRGIIGSKAALVGDIASALCEGGVYGPASDPYYQADYENIMNFVSDAFKNSDMVKNMKVKVPKPNWDEKGMVPI